ncbi:MAG: PHP domain-containing protein [Planctomycetes bacterium]|nr:PHP domain-containing protein [Planctomycetota bacterium]
MSVRGKVDLHFHTECSGDSFIPLYAVIPAAERLGLAAVAKTDHDSVTGCTYLLEAAASSPVEYIPGVELSSAEHFHILGYFIDPEYPELVEATRKEKEYGHTVLQLRLEHWQKHGGPYRNSIDDLLACTLSLRGTGEISLKQVAYVLVGMGFYPDPAAARTDVEERTVDFQPPEHLPPPAAEAVALIGRAGGVAVAAHPRSYTPDAASPPNPAAVEKLVAAGIVGVECYNVKAMTREEQAFWQDFCRERNLVCTGGTDCHNHVEEWNVTQETITPYAAVEGLKARLPSKKRR